MLAEVLVKPVSGFTRNALAQVKTLQQTGVWPKLSSPRAVWKMKRVKEMEALPLLLSVLAFQVTLQLQSAKAGWIVKSSSNSSDSSDSGWRLLDNGTYVRVYGNQDAMGASGTQGSSGGEGSDTRENIDSGWVFSPRTWSSSSSRSFQQFRSSRTVPSPTTHCEDYEEHSPHCNNVGTTVGCANAGVTSLAWTVNAPLKQFPSVLISRMAAGVSCFSNWYVKEVCFNTDQQCGCSSFPINDIIKMISYKVPIINWWQVSNHFCIGLPWILGQHSIVQQPRGLHLRKMWVPPSRKQQRGESGKKETHHNQINQLHSPNHLYIVLSSGGFWRLLWMR